MSASSSGSMAARYGGCYEPPPHLICTLRSVTCHLPKQRNFAEGSKLGTVLDYPEIAAISLVLRRRQVGERQTDWKTLHCWLQRRGMGLQAKGCRASGYCEGTAAGTPWTVAACLDCSQGIPVEPLIAQLFRNKRSPIFYGARIEPRAFAHVM